MRRVHDLIVGTAGHIDHGKTTLLKALTGIDPDRLEEEKRRGITIDIGFAHLQLGAFRLGFIDVPGHEKFVKNMLAGVGGIRLVLLVVAADESVMPQTVEHFQICRLLRIPRGILVLTKKSLVDDELVELAGEEVRELVKGSFLEKAPLAAVDSVTGEGINQLKELLLQEAGHVAGVIDASAETKRAFRLPIDRVFSIRGFGTVVTGTPSAGVLRKDDTVEIYPSGKTGKVRGIEVFNQSSERTVVGQRTALNLTGLDKQDIIRGMVVSRPGLFTPSSMLDVSLDLLPSSPGPLRHRDPMRFHQGSAEVMGRVYLIGEDQLQPGEKAFAQIRLDSPTLSCPGDRFIIRRYSPVTTIGGGVVLAILPEKHTRKKTEAVLNRLDRLETALLQGEGGFDLVLVEQLVAAGGHRGLNIRELVSRTGFVENHIESCLSRLDSLVLVPQAPPLAVSREAVSQVCRKMVAFLRAYHKARPLAQGVPREELKRRFLGNASNAYYQFLLDLLVRENKIQTSGSVVALRGAEVDLSDEQKRLRERILERLAAASLQPPSLDELVATLGENPAEVRNVYHFLLKKGELVKITSELVLTPAGIGDLKAHLKREFPEGKPLTVADFKDLFGISRKYAIPLLEYLDKERFTRRIGDTRVVL
jgi:selenocysteine-specific elongation factor